MDIRSNVLAALTGAPRRIGYDIGGGGWLLTNTLPSDRMASHKVDDWLALLDLLPGESAPAAVRRRPKVAVTAKEKDRAREALQLLGVIEGPVVAYHPGGSHAGKRWPRAQFDELISDLKGSVGGSHVIFLGPDERDFGSSSSGAIIVRPSLRELMALLTHCDILVCNDSGPMHIADALGVPVVAIFEIGNPQWFGPSGARAMVIPGELAGLGLSAAPLDTPPSNPVSVTCVADAVRHTLRAKR
jgi:ADP-heptose:LPS heptosyltransferase